MSKAKKERQFEGLSKFPEKDIIDRLRPFGEEIKEANGKCHPVSGWAIYNECGRPLRSGISFNSENEAWRCYFSNRSGWEKMREFSLQHGYKCVLVTLIPNS